MARNGLQRGLMADAGPWGATLVRFLFGLPFSLLLVGGRGGRSRRGARRTSPAFWLAASTGALSQLLATAALLVAMRRAGFAIGTALQQSSLPLAAILGLIVFHDNLHRLGLGRRGDHHGRAGGADLAEGRERARSRSPARCSAWSRASVSASR